MKATHSSRKVPLELSRSTLIMRLGQRPGEPYAEIISPRPVITDMGRKYYHAAHFDEKKTTYRPGTAFLLFLIIVVGGAFLAWLLPMKKNSGVFWPPVNEKRVGQSHNFMAVGNHPEVSRQVQAENLLARAKQQIALGFLSAPQHNNAYDTYRRLRLVSPAKAEELLDTIMLYYIEKARRELDKKHFIRASALILESARFSHGHTARRGLKEEMLEDLSEQMQRFIRSGVLYHSENSALGIYRLMREVDSTQPEVVHMGEILSTALHDKASEQMEKFHYTLPEEDNAVLTYRAILEIDPKDRRAIAGLRKITGFYLLKAQAYLKRKNKTKTLEMIRRGLTVQPKDQRLQALEYELLSQRETDIQRA